MRLDLALASGNSLAKPRFKQLLRPVATVLAMTLAVNSVALAAPPNPVDIHNAISERGIGKGVKIKETDGTIVTGTLTAIHIDTFELIPVGATQPVTLSYTQVSAVHHSGPGLSTGAKIGIGIGVVALVVVVTAVVYLARHPFY